MLPRPPTVSFLIGGAQKGGTTFLEHNLRKNPHLLLAKHKEVHFFDNDIHFKNDKINYEKYHAYFDLNTTGKLLGEATPIYMYWYQAPKRVWEYNPLMKWIIVLRNPIERAYSHWNMERARKNETLPFFEAIKKEKERCFTALPSQHRIFSYLDRGFYTEQIRRIWHFFPIKQTLFIKSDSMYRATQETLRKICIFLEVEHVPITIEKNKNEGKYVSNLTKIEHKYLIGLFETEIISLEKLLKWDCSDWLLI